MRSVTLKLWFLPAIYALFGLMSVLTLSSIAPNLVPRQLIFFITGGFVFQLLSNLKKSTIQRLAPIGYILLIVFLLILPVISLQTRGATRWIDIGGFFIFQPSQLAVPVVAIFLANFVDTHPTSNWKNLLLTLGIISAPAGLILLQPDLGTTLVYLASLSVGLLFTGINLKQVGVILGVALIVTISSWFLVLKPYQKERIYSFVGIGSTTQSVVLAESQLSAQYNARQSIIAVGSGQFFGRGLGQGSQSHLQFLPERQTDFIFASLTEEFGFIGSLLVLILYIGLFTFLFWFGIQGLSVKKSVYPMTIAGMIMFQSFINIGMNIGLTPITGITLPLLSYGGSSIISIALAFGLVQNFVKQVEKGVTLEIK